MRTFTKIMTLALLFVSSMAFSQQVVLMDVGKSFDEWISPAPYNNVVGYPQHLGVDYPDEIVSLKNTKGALTGFKYEITQGFQYFLGDGIGQGSGAGVPLTGDAAQFDTQATMDCIYTKGTARAVGIITLSGLDNAKFYSFELFASYARKDDGDKGITNRESKITVAGANTEVVYIDALHNASTTVHANDIKPSGGAITIQLEVGANNQTIYSVLNLFKMTETTDALAMEEAILGENGLNIYPNPVGDVLNIDYMLHSESVSSILVYDTTGRMVYNITNNKNRSGIYSFKWNRTDNDGKRLAPGTYFLKLETEKGTYSKKLILK